MAYSLTLPENYNYVLPLPLLLVPILSYAHYATVGALRKPSKIAFPQAYATEEQCKASPAAFKFNCGQRAQANFNEHAPYTALLMLGAGLTFPLITAGLGIAWGLGRATYLYGYVTKGPKGRSMGSWHGVCEAVIMLMAAYSVVTRFLL